MWPRSATARNVGIVFLGDSHTEGHLGSVTVGANLAGIMPLNGVRDLYWNGTADGAYFPACSHINITTGTQDGQSAVGTNNASFVYYVPQVLRRCSSRFGRIRIANGGIGGSSSFTWGSNNAKGYFLVNSLPNAGDTITAGSVTYTFRVAASSANEITIAAGVNAQATSIANAINGEGSGWGTGTVPNPDCYCAPLPTNGYVNVGAKAVGVAGNSATLAVSGGGRITVFVQMSAGAAASSLLTNMIARVPAGFGSVDVVTLALGTNDASTPGWRATGYQAHLAAAIALIEAQWPSAKIILWKPPVTSAGATATTALTTYVNPATATLAAAASNRSYVDMYGVGAGAGDCLVLDSGGVHLTGYGHCVAAELFGNAIATALGLTS